MPNLKQTVDMDLKRAGILLEKINKLYDTMRAAPDEISAVEADLMCDYVRRLYDALLDEAPSADTPADVAEPVEVIRPQTRAPSAESEAVPPADPPQAPPASQPVPDPPSADVPEPRQAALEDEEVEVLFERPPARELAEKLQELPIQDVRRAMGINERIYTVNELFGGDENAFDQTVDHLKRLSSFEQAKAYLIKEVAVPFGWTAPDKRETAKNFIRLVRRLYNRK